MRKELSSGSEGVKFKRGLVIENDDNFSYKPRLDYFKLNGWGYKDTKFVIENNDYVLLTGGRYSFSGKPMKQFKKWVEEDIKLNTKAYVATQQSIPVDEPVLNQEFLHSLENKFSRLSLDDRERVMHSHGHSLQEVYALKYGRLKRVADVVVYPKSHEQVENLVRLAHEKNVVLIPYGGGTNVSMRCFWGRRRSG